MMGIFEEILDKLGQMPLPPYITHQLKDKNRYQTVYAKHNGSAAAPTAGLHFTPELLEEIKDKGRQHRSCDTSCRSWNLPAGKGGGCDPASYAFGVLCGGGGSGCILSMKRKRRAERSFLWERPVCRTLESASAEDGILKAGSGWTEIFIYPGYQFKIVDCLITNFHLPESTLMMLVSALAGKEHIMAAYEEAVKDKYRFFSFGDAMFITEGIE